MCKSPVLIFQFPAVLRGRNGTGAGPAAAMAVQPLGERGLCYFHPEAPAISVCAVCGRFLCLHCDTEWHGEHLCLTCIHDRREVKRAEGFVSKRVIYDNAALAILALPVILIYPFFGLVALVSSPMAMFYLIRYRNAPRGFVPRGPFRMIVAWILSIVMLLGALGLIGVIVYAIFEAAVTTA